MNILGSRIIATILCDCGHTFEHVSYETTTDEAESEALEHGCPKCKKKMTNTQAKRFILEGIEPSGS